MMMAGKIYPGPDEALSGRLFDGMTLMCGGFGLVGVPEDLIAAVRRAGVSGLTVVSNNCGAEGIGLWTLLHDRRIGKMISSYIGGNRLFAERLEAGEVALELTPQGTLAERIRAGGAGIPAFFTRTGAGTVVAEGKPSEDFDGLTYIRERWLRADVALVKAWRADPAGNLQFRKTARNFNPVMATAGRFTVAEVEEIVPAGSLDPDAVHTPGIYVDRVIRSHAPKRVENLTIRARPAETV
jgi:3-oxoacid CoA-transferase subunit A